MRQDTSDVEARLREIREQLRARIGGLAEAPERGTGISFGKRIGDGTVEAVSRLTEVGVGESLELREERVERALTKLAEGTYGVCDSCGQPIPERRLEVVPESVLCVRCASGTPRR